MEFVLSLFPGIGLLDKAFEENGFCVVRGPDVLWGGDVKQFHPPAGKFDGIIGGPPCKPYSTMRHIIAVNHAKQPDKYFPAENLIPEFERCISEAQPAWFLMENVPDAPKPHIEGYAVSQLILNNRWVVDTTPQNRVRRFSFGIRGSAVVDLTAFIDVALFEPIEFEYAVLANGSSKLAPVALQKGGKPKRLPKSGGRTTRTVAECAALQGLPSDFLSKAPFTVEGKRTVIGNGVPLPLGRTIAKAIRRSLELPESTLAVDVVLAR